MPEIIVIVTVKVSEEGLVWQNLEALNRLHEDAAESFRLAVEDDEKHLKQIESRIGRELTLGDRVAVAGELQVPRGQFAYGQVHQLDSSEEASTPEEIASLFEDTRKWAQVSRFLDSIRTHVQSCDQWSEGQAFVETRLRNQSYQCGCGEQFRIHTALIGWAEYHSGALPSGFTNKMRFLKIRGEYWRSLAEGTHEIVNTISDNSGWFSDKLGTVRGETIPRHVGTMEVVTDDSWSSYPSGTRLKLTLQPLGGVVPDKNDQSPTRSHSVINLSKIEVLDAEGKTTSTKASRQERRRPETTPEDGAIIDRLIQEFAEEEVPTE